VEDTLGAKYYTLLIHKIFVDCYVKKALLPCWNFSSQMEGKKITDTLTEHDMEESRN